MEERIWLSPPHMSGNEQKYIQLAFDENYIAPAGSNLKFFEDELGAYYDHSNVAVLVSGTAALHLALVIAGVKQNDEVLASTFTFSATINTIIYQGAIPVLVESESDSWNMSPGLLEKAIIDRIAQGKKPKAIIVVHLYGMPAKMDLIVPIAAKYNIPIIEDAAEAIGSKYKGQKLGTYGKIGVLSFNGNKIITTSGGGALISKDNELIKRAKYLATQARQDAPHYQHIEIGYNYRMSNILAGIGRGQLEVIDDRIQKRRANHDFYMKRLGSVAGILVLNEYPDAYSNYWLSTIVINPELTGGITRDDIRLGLEKENIESRPLWKPMHLQPVFAHCPAYVDGTSEALFRDGLCLPSGSNLTDDQKERIVTTILNILKK